ncbi:outer membrane protein assembly factor BamB family protein [Streptomyces hiroshimensis]|uniref:Pyrrolo-quinoline quinone repeat domain-containing protein n=1 Tax=Streptomyces hiroshimensis TaxID=66424 RepID=A0ABQ2ZF75_9ACTN|nr:PQQ-binding-like beta-propeller repeat protein [Streptomyces hiroshimensis]GGY11460.1 hypothetical protein GCM10010324_67750 [Streptomyces hiroshimensis]
MPVTLHERLAYVAASDSLQAVDTATGEVLSTFRPRHKALYTDKHFDASTVVDGVIAGRVKETGDETRLKALDLNTGETRWTAEKADYKATVAAAGPHLLLHTRPGVAFASQPASSLIDVRTGKVAKDIDGHFSGECTFDGLDNTICHTIEAPDKRVFAVDAKTGDMRWQLPDPAANRIAPEVTSVYKGRVYGTTRDNGPIALNSRTGADIRTSPELAPILVNGYTGLTIDEGTVVAHHAAS